MQTSVEFSSADVLEEHLFSEAERKAKENIRVFGDRRVLIEGGGYMKIWLETQPMGGEMYAKRDTEIAMNNVLLFMENANEKGRLPGSIKCEDGKVIPEFNKFQGYCFPIHALNLYYINKDRDYLDFLKRTLAAFDDYLWKYRDSDGDGCLETWCVFDTGEDNTLRFGPDAENYAIGEKAPEGMSILPAASMDFMSYSYSTRDVLSRIAAIEGKEEVGKLWRTKAEDVKRKMRDYLWDNERSAFFDRDKNHNVLPTLAHNTLRCMYWGSIGKKDADAFVRKHLLNPEEFWTKMPLPSIAVNDPLFRNVTENAWSGQSEALTYQRAIRALENYGYDYLVPVLGRKLMTAIGMDGVFVQQYDPFTMKPSLAGEQDSYGPAILSVLEYIAHSHGVYIEQDRIYWCNAEGSSSDYTQHWGDRSCRIVRSGDKAECFINDKKLFSLPIHSKAITDLDGNIIKLIYM